MKKILVAIIAMVAIVVGYWLISPLFRTEYVSEDLPASSESAATSTAISTSPVVLKSGVFTGFDRLHNGSGTVKVIQVEGKTYLRFEDDFNVTNGPDLYVGLGRNGEYVKDSELARLKGNVGSQNYEVPGGMNPSDIHEVWVWCKAFSTPFVRAVLQ